jgi:tetratricopeptide (TPR) repeat protein
MHRALAHAQLGHVEEANNDIDAVLAAEPETAGALKDVALLLATNANDGVRDGARAICIAEQGCKVTEYEDPALLDALGCAYAELGNFEAATKWSEMAVGLCQTDQREKYAEHLELFRRGKSLRKH